ncbi:MAG: ribosome silencing factor [Christensenellales bacterium]|jgi:ribosome-associated protein|nr:ribosome silencing factor [Eubacteriales bacterium]
MQPEQLKDKIVEILEEKKAVDISVIPVAEKTIIADYFVICTAYTKIQIRAIADALLEKLEEVGAACLHTDGMPDSKWIVLDYGSVIVHIFNDQTRVFYCLEKLWAGSKDDVQTKETLAE